MIQKIELQTFILTIFELKFVERKWKEINYIKWKILFWFCI
jgi:hypothetical protein